MIMKKRLFISLLFIISSFSYSQNVRIENLKVNGSSTSTINLRTNTEVNVTLRLDISRPRRTTINLVEVFLEIVDNSGDRTQITDSRYFDLTDVESASADEPFEISETDINFGSGNYLVAVMKLTYPPGTEWTSQQIPIIKTPSFELEPSAVNIPCGDTSPQTFTVSNNSNLGGISY